MHSERDKFLTEAMGICFWLGHDCEKCKGKPRRILAINFSTHENFFRLWKWSREQIWWSEFESYWTEYSTIPMLVEFDVLANTIHEFLKARVK